MTPRQVVDAARARHVWALDPHLQECPGRPAPVAAGAGVHQPAGRALRAVAAVPGQMRSGAPGGRRHEHQGRVGVIAVVRRDPLPGDCRWCRTPPPVLAWNSSCWANSPPWPDLLGRHRPVAAALGDDVPLREDRTTVASGGEPYRLGERARGGPSAHPDAVLVGIEGVGARGRRRRRGPGRCMGSWPVATLRRGPRSTAASPRRRLWSTSHRRRRRSPACCSSW